MTELPAGYLLRRPMDTDAEGILKLLIACDIEDEGHPDSTLEDVKADWSMPRFDRDRDSWIVVGPDRDIVGYAWAWDRVPHVDVQADVHVGPSLRSGPIGEALLGLVETRAREHVTAAPRGTAVELYLFAKVESVLARLLESRGYQRVRTFLRMTIELTKGYPAPFTPPGIDIAPFRRGVDERALQDVIEDAFADHFRFAAEPHEEWVARRVGHPEFDAGLWLLARDGEKVVGGILPYPFGELGWVRELGVRSGWRGRGIGKALLLQTFRTFDERGWKMVSLGVDAANASGATKLYQDMGMFVEERHDLYRLEVRP